MNYWGGDGFCNFVGGRMEEGEVGVEMGGGGRLGFVFFLKRCGGGLVGVVYFFE